MVTKLITETPEGFRIPGFIDAHVHIESSHLRPSEFGRLLVSKGTFAAVCDPHEIVNVLGEDGLRFMIEDAKKSPAQLFFELPSCVPATPFETSGACLSAEDTGRLFDRYPELMSLGEMMNVPGVIGSDPEVMGKIIAAKVRGKRISGHFPGGTGTALRTYASRGISSDHESVSADEALEKIENGMTVFIREGSAAKNLEALLPAIDDSNLERFCFCADDISAADLLAHGDILNCVRKAVSLGLSPERAIAIACDNPSRYFGITFDPGDYVLVDNLSDFNVKKVVKNGIEYR